jgi:hypothetical protein
MSSSDDQNFLRRWSRLKRQPAVAAEVSAPPPELPPLESLNFDSDFGAFMHAKVDAQVRRAALKKLFRDPRFNVMDGLDVYIDDYSKEDPISPGMLAQLEHARNTLFAQRTEAEARQEGEITAQLPGTQAPPASSNQPPESEPELEDES